MGKKYLFGFEIMFYETMVLEQLWQFLHMMKEILNLQESIDWR
jgi:hypothetical protein